MNRQPSACDFCGSPDPLIPYDEPAFCWYACPECTQLIENEDWNTLVARCVAGHKATESVSAGATRVIAEEALATVSTIRESLLAAAVTPPAAGAHDEISLG